VRAAIAVLLLAVASADDLGAQTYGDIVGRVRQSRGRGVGLGGARVDIVGTPLWAVTDYKGRYRIHAVPVGRQVVSVEATGYATARQDDVPVSAGVETQLDFFLPRDTMTGAPLVSRPVIDPRGWGGAERLDALDLAALPVIDVAEGTSLWSDAQGVSYGAGRPGSQQLAIDGTLVRSPYDGSTSALGLRVPLGILEEVSLANDPWIGPGGLSGLQRLISADGGGQWRGRVGFQTDRPFSGPADMGFDRVVARAEGPVGHAQVIGVLDATGRFQAEPLSAPRGDPRTPAPWALGHDAAEWIDGALKVHVPLGARHSLRVLAVRSQEQRSLFDPVFKYDPGPGAGRRITATLIAAEVRRASQSVTTFLRARYFARSFTESDLAAAPTYAFGALGGRYDFLGSDVARSQDTAAAREPIPGFVRPEFSDATPWGVAAFFLRGGSRGSVLSWNQYREARLELALTAAPTQSFTVSGDASLAVGRVRAFQRVLGSLPVGDSVPLATAATLSPVWLTVGSRAEGRLAGGLLVASLRLDVVSPGVSGASGMRASISPLLGVSAPLGGALFSLTAARVSQFPDLQFLSNAAFDDSLAGGRFRRGDPDLGYEHVGLVEVQFKLRVRQDATLRAVLFKRRFDDLVASTPAAIIDSSAFGNRDRLDVTGGEIMLDKGLGARTRLTASYAVEDAAFEAVNGFRVASGIPILKSDLLGRFVVTARGVLPGTVEAGAVLRVSRTPFSLVPSDLSRPAATVDVVLRRAVRLGRWNARAYLDGRNLLNTRAIVAVPPGGTPGLDSAAIENLAQAAYAASPGSIPYDSPRYRAFADLDANGIIEGSGELLPLFRAAAADFAQPLRAYGRLRSVRVGVEVAF